MTIILSIFVNGTLAVFFASWQVLQLQKYVSDDAMLVCTGDQFKWISQTIYLETGQFSFIEPPADAPDKIDQVDCSYSFLADNQSDLLNLPVVTQKASSYKNHVARLVQRPYTSFPYQQGLSRAPPDMTFFSS